MRHFYSILAFLIILYSLLSCKKVIDIELPAADPKIVVNSFFTNNSPIKVHLSKSIGTLESLYPECTDASVIMKENNIIIDTMYFKSGYYYSHILAGSEKNYALEVHTPGMEPVSCEDLIPERTILKSLICTDSVLTDEDGMIINELKIEFQDPAGPSFYEVELSAEDTTRNYIWRPWFKKNTDPIITSTGLLDYEPRTLIFTDKMFDGKHTTVKVYFSYDWEHNYKLKFFFRSISESYFRYKEKQFAYLFSLDNDIFRGMSEPINLYSNINGGYGIFAGYSSDEKVITIKDK